MTQDYKPSLIPLSSPGKKDPQRRKADPLQDTDVRDKVWTGEELTGLEKFLRRVATQKKAIGGFLIGVGTLASVSSSIYPGAKWLILATVLSNTAGGLLVGAGSTIKSDSYEREKNQLLKQRDLM